MIELRLLGPIELVGADGRELRSVLTHPKRLAVLVYLAAARPRGFQRRDKLVALFWPELDQARARQALNKAVHHFRRAMGDAAIVSRGDDELSLDDQVVRCDVWQFEAALGADSAAAALALYRGDLADALFIDGAAEFEQWLSAERERLCASAARAAGSVADAMQHADLPAAVDAARRAVALAPYDERALRRLMLLLEQTGDRPGAALAYANFSRRLQADLELEPSSETRALRDALARQVPRSASAAAPGPSTPATFATPVTITDVAPVEPERTPRRRSRWLIPLAGVAAFALAGSPFGLHRLANQAPAASPDPHRVLVTRIENRTGDTTLDVVGAMATDWISHGLTIDNVAHVVRSPDARAGLVISGAFYRKGDSLQFQAQVADPRDAGNSRALQSVAAPVKNPTPALESLRDQALSLVAQATTPRLSPMLRGLARPPLYAAYREYVLGMDLYKRRENARAYEHLKRAVAIDSTFDVARLAVAVMSEENEGARVADSLVHQLVARRETLSPLGQTWLDMMLAYRRGDIAEELRHVEILAREMPESPFPYRAGITLYAFRRLNEAAAQLRALDPHGEWLAGFYSYWVILTMADHAIGDAKSEERDVLAARRDHPDNPAIASLAARLLASTGRLAQADSLLDEARSMRPNSTWNAGSVFAVATLEATAHGHADWTPRVRERALRWYRELPTAMREREAGAYGLTWILYSVGAWPELETRVARLAREAPDDARWIAFGGLIAANRGDTLRARAADARLARMVQEEGVESRRALLLYERARITATIGARDAAVELLRQAFTSGLGFSIHIHTDPAFASLRDYPPFVRVIAPKDQGARAS
jgi:DNA-binding SARP family transcriptional activator